MKKSAAVETINLSKSYLKVPECAARLNVSKRTVWSWIYARKLPVMRLNGSVRIPIKTLDTMIEEATIPVREAS